MIWRAARVEIRGSAPNGDGDMTLTCYECGAEMGVEPVRPDPHEPPEMMLVCAGCGRSEPAPADVESQSEDRPRLPGL